MSGASEKWRDRQGPECRASGRQQSVRRDHFPFKVREQGAGLEQTGAEGRPIVREVERVCGRLRRSQSRRRVAVRAEVPWATKVLRGLEPSWRDQSGTRA